MWRPGTPSSVPSARAARRLPRGHVGLDLPRVDLQVLGVDAEPVLRGVPARPGVATLAAPRGLRQAAKESGGVGAYRPDCGERRLQGMAVVVAGRRPHAL